MFCSVGWWGVCVNVGVFFYGRGGVGWRRIGLEFFRIVLSIGYRLIGWGGNRDDLGWVFFLVVFFIRFK